MSADTFSVPSGRVVCAGAAPRFGVSDCVVAGDSLTEYGTGYSCGFPASGSKLRLVYNAGVASDTLDLLWARWQTTVIDKLPNGGVIFLRIGTNSIGETTASFSAKYQRFVDDVIARPTFKLVMHAIPPKTSGNGATIRALNLIIAGKAAQLPERLRFTDDCKALGDANYEPLAENYVDLIHFSQRGSWLVGAGMAPDLKNWIQAPNVFITDGADKYLTNPASKQYIKNPLMTGSAGSASGVVGAVCNDFAVYPYGGGLTANVSIVPADADDPVNTPWQRVSPMGATGGGGYLYVTADTSHPAFAAIDPVKRLDTVFEVRFVNFDSDASNGISSFILAEGQNAQVAVKMGTAGAGVLNGTYVFRNSGARAQYAISANSMKLYIEIGFRKAFTGPIGSIDIRCVSIRSQED